MSSCKSMKVSSTRGKEHHVQPRVNILPSNPPSNHLMDQFRPGPEIKVEGSISSMSACACHAYGLKLKPNSLSNTSGGGGTAMMGSLSSCYACSFS